ncbi:hypothetical protein TNCV_5048341, partial [Trichonephila clavipes]
IVDEAGWVPSLSASNLPIVGNFEMPLTSSTIAQF